MNRSKCVAVAAGISCSDCSYCFGSALLSLPEFSPVFLCSLIYPLIYPFSSHLSPLYQSISPNTNPSIDPAGIRDFPTWNCVLRESCTSVNFFFWWGDIIFAPRSCIVDGRVELCHRVFFSTSHRLSVGWNSGLCGSKFMCKNDFSRGG